MLQEITLHPLGTGNQITMEKNLGILKNPVSALQDIVLIVLVSVLEEEVLNPVVLILQTVFLVLIIHQVLFLECL